MPYLCLATEPDQNGALVWIAAIQEGSDHANVTLTVNTVAHPLGPWTIWMSEDQNIRMDYQRVVVRHLSPATQVQLQVLVNGQVRATSRFRTLPDRLPIVGETPFRVLLGSCYWQRNDDGVAQTYAQLPEPFKPDVQILCGDQVYLDAPWFRFLFRIHDRLDLQKDFFDRYFKSWSDHGPKSLHRLLTSSATFFTADDHEFWNNAPNPSSFSLNTFTASGRAHWRDVAISLYRAFQTERTVQRWRVGNLSFCVADTRQNRSDNRTDLVTSADLEAIQDWVSTDLTHGPGVLVLGQPLFSTTAGPLGHLADWSLPDFAQYRELVRILDSARSSIVILSGDVHFGRMATAARPGGPSIVEVISSPMAFITGDKSTWKRAPEVYPSIDSPPVPKRRVDTEPTRLTRAHFMTLEFSEAGHKIRMQARAWPIGEAGPIDLTTQFLEGPIS